MGRRRRKGVERCRHGLDTGLWCYSCHREDVRYVDAVWTYFAVVPEAVKLVKAEPRQLSLAFPVEFEENDSSLGVRAWM